MFTQTDRISWNFTRQVVGKWWCRMPQGMKWTRASTTLWRPGEVEASGIRTFQSEHLEDSGRYLFTIGIVFWLNHIGQFHETIMYESYEHFMWWINHERRCKEVAFSKYETRHPDVAMAQMGNPWIFWVKGRVPGLRPEMVYKVYLTRMRSRCI